MASLSALLGRIFSRGVELELQGGLNFESPLSAEVDLENKRINVAVDADDLSELVAVEAVGLLAHAGAGTDGNLTAASGTTTLTGPTYYDEVVLTGTAKINAGPHDLFIRKCSIIERTAGATGKRAIYRAGQDLVAPDGPTNNGGAAQTFDGRVLGGGGVGGQGGLAGGVDTNGSAGAAYTQLDLGNGGIGGRGGDGGDSNTGKTGGAGQAGQFPAAQFPWQSHLQLPQRAPTGSSGGTVQSMIGGSCGGGGGGGGAGSAAGGGQNAGGGGGGVGVLEVWIGELITDASTPEQSIDCRGGEGSRGEDESVAGNGGGGGGGGAGGGHTRCTIGKRTGDPVTNLVCATGGVGGNGHTHGTCNEAGLGGQAGGGGQVMVCLLSTGVTQYKIREAAAPAQPVTSTGGTPTVWGLTV